MTLPEITVLMTINNRSVSTMARVFDSLAGEAFARMIIVLDAAGAEVDRYSRKYWENDPRVTFVTIERPAGWLCPAAAWNRGFASVETEMVYCISSEVIQKPGNVLKARELLSGLPAVVFGKCRDDGDAPATGYREDPHLLCGAELPRPLGFIWAFPMWMVRATGGYDERYMDGICYEDDDFSWRLWSLGHPFIFSDSIEGVHQHHPRPQLEPALVERSRQRTIAKWGDEHPWNVGVKSRAELTDGTVVLFAEDPPWRATPQLWGIPAQK